MKKDMMSINVVIGMFIELEHTDDLLEALKIATDHILEQKDYYTNPHNPFLTELHKEIMPIVQKSMKVRGMSSEEIGMGEQTDYSEKLDTLKERRDPDGIEDDLSLDAHIGWEAMVKKLKGQGHSQESAEKIAYSIGRKKYGKAGMAKKAAAGRKDSEPDELSEVQDNLGMGVELLITPIIKKLMQKLGFQKMRWIGRGWFVPITGTTYTNFLTKIPFFKAFDDQFKKFGYQIRISPVGFFVEPVKGDVL